ncbi:MAG: transposase [Flavobacteriales bacterium]|nr:transposase [Flavobacteriales bacterium]
MFIPVHFSLMPRRPRDFLPNVPVHLIQRGNDRKVCFLTDRDYTVYLNKLRECSNLHGVAIHSFVLMTNHVHLLCTPERPQSISLMMQGLGRYYVRYINSTYKRTGTLWEGRFKASLLSTERYFLTVSRYIELNPIRAGMVKHPAEYPWSSYRHNASGKRIKLITPHPVYLSLGRSKQERRARYQALFDQLIPSYTLEEIRTATNKAWVLGDGKFKQQIEQQLGYALPPFQRGGDRKSSNFRRISKKQKIKVL